MTNKPMSASLENWLTWAIQLLATIAALGGLLWPTLYRDAPLIVPQLLGQDLVTVAVGIPLLILGMVWKTRGSIRGRLIWLGALGYLLYTYGTYALGARWNELFLIYVALFGLCLYTFMIGVLTSDATEARSVFAPRIPTRLIAFFLIGTGSAFALLWLAENVRALVTGTIPQSLIEGDLPTNIIHVFDLAIVLPALILTGAGLLRDRPWAYVLTGVLLVKAATLGLAVSAMGYFVIRSGSPAPLLPLFAALTVGSGLLCWIYLRPSADRRGQDARSRATVSGVARHAFH